MLSFSKAKLKLVLQLKCIRQVAERIRFRLALNGIYIIKRIQSNTRSGALFPHQNAPIEFLLVT